MVSVYPNPPPGQDFYYYHNSMGLPGGGSGSLQPAPEFGGVNDAGAVMNPNTIMMNTGVIGEDPNKKVRKPYTITKSRESWTEQEHDKFLEALQLFDRDWKKIEAFVGSKTVIQIRSHAQKYFLKVQKSGTSEHVPPPRPKRKATHPYPQKAPKNAVSQMVRPYQPSSSIMEPGYIVQPDSLAVPMNPINDAAVSAWAYNTVPTLSMSSVTKGDMGVSSAITNCSSSSNESTPMMRPTNETKNCEKEKQNEPVRVMPDFAQVYSFIGSVFDPNASDHLQRLKKMDPINVETVLMLMKNLSINLTSPEFENHRRMISSYCKDGEKENMTSAFNTFQVDKPGRVIPSQ